MEIHTQIAYRRQHIAEVLHNFAFNTEKPCLGDCGRQRDD